MRRAPHELRGLTDHPNGSLEDNSAKNSVDYVGSAAGIQRETVTAIQLESILVNFIFAPVLRVCLRLN